MNMIFKIMLFSIMLNFSTAIMAHVLPEINSNYNILVDPADKDAAVFQAGMNSTIQPTTESNSFFRLLDNIVVGVISRLLSVVQNYSGAFVSFICHLFKLDMWIQATLQTILHICYILGAVWLWTGKSLT